jgi:long-subunit acyl-CoA synthetase (AMP-forming)
VWSAGTPKGVQLTHRNLTSDVKGMGLVIPDGVIPVSRSVAFLPWAHCESEYLKKLVLCDCVLAAPRLPALGAL